MPKEEKPKIPLSISFDDNPRFNEVENMVKYKISQVRIWTDSDRIFGLKFIYEDRANKNNKIEGLVHVPLNFLKKPTQEKKFDGELKKIIYKNGYDNWVRTIIFECEVMDEKGNPNTIEHYFGSVTPILNSKEIIMKNDQIALKTNFSRKESFSYSKF